MMAACIPPEQLVEKAEALEKARRGRLSALGVSRQAQEDSSLPAHLLDRGSEIVRLMNFNVLASGLANDGFLVKPVLADWPAGPGKVPKSGSGPVLFQTLCETMLSSCGKEAALKSVKAQYDLPASRANFHAVVDWQARRLQIQRLILSMGCPDVIVMQELDNYAQMAEDLAQFGYTSKLPQGCAPYTPAHMHGYTDRDQENAERFCRAWEAKGHAFLPHLHSNALHLSLVEGGLVPKILAAADALGIKDKVTDPKTGKLSRCWSKGLPDGSMRLLKAAGVEPSRFDDMGVAVFWRVHRFCAKSLKMRTYSGGGAGMVEVRLQDMCCDDRELVVIGSHLSSGDTIKDEQKRLDNEVEETNGGCLRSCSADLCDRGDAVVLMLDANSNPQACGLDGSSSCWRSLRGAVGASVWDSYFDASGAVTASDGLDAPVTSNKIRGPLSGQAKKIGAHAYGLIDHIFFTPSAFKSKGHILQPNRFASSTTALEDVLPSLSNPSDHYPVVVDLSWRPVGEPDVKKRKVVVGGA